MYNYSAAVIIFHQTWFMIDDSDVEIEDFEELDDSEKEKELWVILFRFGTTFALSRFVYFLYDENHLSESYYNILWNTVTLCNSNFANRFNLKKFFGNFRFFFRKINFSTLWKKPTKIENNRKKFRPKKDATFFGTISVFQIGFSVFIIKYIVFPSVL